VATPPGPLEILVATPLGLLEILVATPLGLLGILVAMLLVPLAAAQVFKLYTDNSNRNSMCRCVILHGPLLNIKKQNMLDVSVFFFDTEDLCCHFHARFFGIQTKNICSNSKRKSCLTVFFGGRVSLSS
jgi:hypothetical protein